MIHPLSPQVVQSITLLFVSTLLGGAVGYERELHERPAGLRTHILVCVSATLLTLVSNQASHGADRIAAQIVSGVGFLGAGTILRSNGGIVRGLTTAASVWLVAALGIAVGYGGHFVLYAVATTAIALTSLLVFARLEMLFGHTHRRQEVSLLIDNSGDQTQAVGTLLKGIQKCGVRVREVNTASIGNGHLIKLALSVPDNVERKSLDELFQAEPRIAYYDWTTID